MKYLSILPLLFIALPAFSQETSSINSDSAIRRVENCVCYKSVDGQKMEPWELSWDNPEELRKQISHCVCEVFIDIQSVENPARYIVPGTVVK